MYVCPYILKQHFCFQRSRTVMGQRMKMETVSGLYYIIICFVFVDYTNVRFDFLWGVFLFRHDEVISILVLKRWFPCIRVSTWWRHQMETFYALLAICAGNSPVSGEFRTQIPVTRSFNVFFDLRLNKRLSKQPWGWWFETLSHPLWRHCNLS